MNSITKNIPIQDGAHILYVFNDLDKYMLNAIHFISEALTNSEKMIVIEDDHFWQRVKDEMHLLGFKEKVIDQIIFINHYDYYVQEQLFNGNNSLRELQSMLQDDIQQKKHIRIWGRVLTQNCNISQIRGYEYACDSMMRGERILSVCSYNGLTIPASIQNELLKVHSYFMIDNELSPSPLYRKEHLGALPIAEHKRLQKLEQEIDWLRKQNEALSMENELQKAIEKKLQLAKVEAEKANEMKTAFLSQMSHDLRTPLNTIQGYTQVMLSKQDLEYAQSNRLQKILGATKHLSNLIEEILDFSAIEAGNIKTILQSIHIKSFIQDCLEAITKQVDTNVNFSIQPIDDHLYLEADSVRLQQVLYNLFTNAMKYSQHREEIQIEVKEKDSHISIHVIDKGIGIPQEEIQSIFKPFYRGKFHSSLWKGTGLGLAIVARLTKKMNGDYGVYSTEGSGSTFWVTFKKSDVQHATQQEEEVGTSSMEHSEASKKILYIEDNLDNIELMHEMIDTIGDASFFPATTAKAGLHLAVKIKPDIILLDLGLPDLPGIDVLKQLKSNIAVQHIPVIIVSADALNSSMKEAAKLGSTNYITKPINLNKLRKALFQET